MDVDIYQVDAFTTEVFGGNPAAVCPLDSWISDDLMQKIAFENNLSETAFYVEKEEGYYEIRWFTPTTEVSLCGHATLAAAYVEFYLRDKDKDKLVFNSKGGVLRSLRQAEGITLDFPQDDIRFLELTNDLVKPFEVEPVAAYRGKSDIMLVFDSEDDIALMIPEWNELVKIETRGIIVTAPGKTADFVSRYFSPQSGIDEDPVTGSAHTTLAPYWAQRLDKTTLLAKQLSERGGDITCTLQENRVLLQGTAVLYLKGKIII